MSNQQRTAGDWTRVAVIVTAVFAVCLGLVDLMGWYSHNAVLLQIRPDLHWVAMHYDTGLSFLLCGAGLLAVAFGRLKLAVACVALPLLIASLDLVEHFAGVELGVDQLLMRQDDEIGSVATTHPGRIAVQTCLCFLLTGAALLLMSRPGTPKSRPLAGGVLGSLLVALGVVGACGYLLGVKTYGWGAFHPIAVHTATGFAVLGLGVVAFAWRDGRATEEGAPRWLPVPVGLAIVAATLCLWQALIAEVTFSVPAVTLVVGFVMAGLFALLVYVTQTAVRSVRAIRKAVGQLASTSEGLLANASQRTAGAQEQAAAVAETVTSVAEVAQTAAQAALRVKEVGAAAQAAAALGKDGRRAVEDSIAAMGAVRLQVESIAENILTLAEQAQAIGEIIALVNEIAEQSNLLSLNAVIEAARAGEQGKGFSVVAREVKAMSERSKQATSQVRQILGQIQKATYTVVLSTEQGTKAVAAATEVAAQAGETIKVLADTLAETATASAQIVASAVQQATGMAQVNAAMQNIEEVTRENEAAVQQVEQAAENLNALSTHLAGLTAG